MVRKYVDPGPTGELRPERVPSGESHTFVVRRLALDHRYHDDDPVQDAPFTVRFPNGFEVNGTLDKQGRAVVLGVPAQCEVRYGPDQRAFEPVDDRENPDHREQLAESDLDALFEKYKQ